MDVGKTVGIDYEVRKLSGWLLAFAVAEYASGREVRLDRACGKFPFKFVDVVAIPVKGEGGAPDYIKYEEICSCFTNDDFLRILKQSGIQAREVGIMFSTKVEGFPPFESIDRYEAMGRALVARCAKSEIVTVPEFL